MRSDLQQASHVGAKAAARAVQAGRRAESRAVASEGSAAVAALVASHGAASAKQTGDLPLEPAKVEAAVSALAEDAGPTGAIGPAGPGVGSEGAVSESVPAEDAGA